MRSKFVLFMLMSLLTGSLMANSEAQIYGYVEKATLIDQNLTLSAKLDTGAKSASLHAVNITEIEKKAFPIYVLPFQPKPVITHLKESMSVK